MKSVVAERFYCEECKKYQVRRSFYEFHLKNNDQICKKCFCNYFEELKNKFGEDVALYFTCDKCMLVYDFELYTKIKKSSKINTFKRYITVISSINKKNSLDYVRMKLDEYLNDNNIKIINTFTFDYETLFEESKISEILKRFKTTMIEFITFYYNYRYSGYMFSTLDTEYYSKKSNLNKEFRYFIEKDLKLDIKLIPTKITMSFLKYNNEKLYFSLVKKESYLSLFDLIDSCYPRCFKKSDFIMKESTIFESKKEDIVDTYLRGKFRNVLYNDRFNIGYRIDNMIPDWFIFTDKGVVIVEYFGMEVEKPKDERLIYYKKRTRVKLKRYESVIGYFQLFIYQYDLENNFEKLDDKIKFLKKCIDLS